MRAALQCTLGSLTSLLSHSSADCNSPLDEQSAESLKEEEEEDRVGEAENEDPLKEQRGRRMLLSFSPHIQASFILTGCMYCCSSYWQVKKKKK